MGATEGPDTEPERIVPTIQPAPGQYDPAGVEGVLRFAEELQKRGLYGIYMLNNFWQWSGGFAQYIAWAGGGPIPYPPPAPGGSWDRFQNSNGSFYKNAQGVELVRQLRQVPRPAAQEQPDGDLGAGQRAARDDQPSRRFTTGSTRRRASSSRWRPAQLVHHRQRGADRLAAVRGRRSGQGSRERGDRLHLLSHVGRELELGPRRVDPRRLPAGRSTWRRSTSPSTPSWRPRAASRCCSKSSASRATAAASIPRRRRRSATSTSRRSTRWWRRSSRPRRWRGSCPGPGAATARPPRPGEFWKPGDPFVGDPPHEKQGWYSIYDKDTTLKLISDWSPQNHGTPAAPAAAPTAALPSSERPSAG